MNKRLIFSILFVLCFLFSGSAARGNGSSPRLGVWISVFSPEEVLYSKKNVDKLIETCEKTGITDIYLQLYRANKAYYDSSITDRTPYDTLSQAAGMDTISYLLSSSSKKNIKVHAWVNVLSIAQNTDADILKKYGRDVLTKDQHGRFSMSINGRKDELDRYYIRENQLFLEPGDWRVRKYALEIIEEIIEKYPALSGVHLDYIRYPSAVPFTPGSRFTPRGINYGFTKLNLMNFRKAAKLDPKTMEYNRVNSALWDSWRRERVTLLVSYISGRVKTISPDLEVSATVVPSIERSYLVTFQNWASWIKKGYVDSIVVMNYTENTPLMKLYSESILMPEVREKVQIGIGAYLMKDDIKEVKEQLDSLLEIAPEGIVIYSYDEVASSDELKNYLEEKFK